MKKKKRRGSSRYYFIYIFLILLIIMSVIGIRSLITKLSFFEISEIKIMGNHNLEKDFLKNLSKDCYGKNLYAISKNEIQRRYTNIVRVKNANISRIFPHKLRIKIVERLGLFYLKTKEGELFPIDNEKIVLDNDNFYSAEILPVIETDLKKENIVYGETIENDFVNKVFDFYEKVQLEDKEFIDKISEFYLENGDICMTEVNIGYKIIFGEDDIRSKLLRFNFLEKNKGFEKDNIVDLRFSNQLIVGRENS
ncbi:MAG TPA: FtsQ-type POTRA domain-containing protein [Candidatus Cloacimonetes bacterium]|nr:FtsQ-type POTRA domain-containing protein [Candidatus Cloacimonadota bacterium]